MNTEKEIKEIIHLSKEALVHFITLDNENEVMFFSTLETIYAILNNDKRGYFTTGLNIYDYKSYKDEKFLYIETVFPRQYDQHKNQSLSWPVKIKIPIFLLEELFILEKLK